MSNPTTPTTRPASKIVEGLTEALRVATLIRAVADIDDFEMTEQEAVRVLSDLDAVDPLRMESTR